MRVPRCKHTAAINIHAVLDPNPKHPTIQQVPAAFEAGGRDHSFGSQTSRMG